MPDQHSMSRSHMKTDKHALSRWDNEGGSGPYNRHTTSAQEDAMNQLGIQRMSNDEFQIGVYRYANLADAIAKAEEFKSLMARAGTEGPTD